MILHIPVFSSESKNLEAYALAGRFCSFGSTWDKKVGTTKVLANCITNKNYLSIDLTELFTDAVEKTLIYNEGLVIKKTKSEEKFVPVSTGDSYSYPQVLEIKYY